LNTVRVPFDDFGPAVAAVLNALCNPSTTAQPADVILPFRRIIAGRLSRRHHHRIQDPTRDNGVRQRTILAHIVMPAHAGIHDFACCTKASRGCRPEPVLGRAFGPTRGPA